MWTLVVAVPDPVPILKMPCCLRVVLASFGPLLLFLLLLLICSDPLDPLDPLLQVTESEEETSPYRFPFPFLYAQEAELPEYGSDQEEEDRSSKRVRRDHLEPRDKKDYSAPVSHGARTIFFLLYVNLNFSPFQGKRLLDNIIHRKIETMTVKIVIALNALRAKIKHNNLKKYTQGWSILIGSWKDIFSKWNLA